MAKDVAPDLYNDIGKSFERRMEGDKTVQRIEARIKAGKATQADMSAFASKVGIHTSGAFKEVLTPENLPDGKLYWNIAERTIAPRLEEDHEMVLSRARDTQISINKAAGVGLKPPKTELNQDRVLMLMNMACAEGADLTAVFGDPVITLARQMYDDFQFENAKNCNNAGIDTYVVREYDGVGLHDGKDACMFCIERAGEWSYDDAKTHDVYRRHTGCGCTLTTEYRGMKQDVWSKATWTGDDPEARKAAIETKRQEMLEKASRHKGYAREREVFIRERMNSGMTANDAYNAWRKSR